VLLDAGDEVIIPSPCWQTHADLVLAAQAVPVIVPTDPSHGFVVQAEQVRAAMTGKTRAVMLNSPVNPTGVVLTEQEIRPIVELCAERNVTIVADEIYRQYVYETEYVSVPRLAQQAGAPLVIIEGVSKTYAMTGFRIGFAIAHPQLLRPLLLLQGNSLSCAAAPMQAAALSALTGPQDVLARFRDELSTRRRLMVELVSQLPRVKLPVPPHGAFFVFFDVRDWYGARAPDGTVIRSDLDLVDYLVDSAHCGMIPGSANHYPGFVRFTYAATPIPRIREGLDRIAHALDGLVF